MFFDIIIEEQQIDVIYQSKQIFLNLSSLIHQMINQITCNSNNAIELSRGELLQWINQLLKTNYNKIEQMGTGAAYCQLLDLIYPGKVPLNKVNWKAKFDYQYLNNFKILQQSFTKLNIMKHIDVEKLVKCKYQDNLEFLQWFKKIFDNTGSGGKEYDAVTKRNCNEKVDKSQKQNKQLQSLNSNSFSLNETDIKKEQTESKKFMCSSSNFDEKLLQIFNEVKQQNNDYCLKKIKEIQYLMDSWDVERNSADLIQNIRKIILAVPEVNWGVDNGQYWEEGTN